MSKPKILIIFMEPAKYILDLSEELNKLNNVNVDIYFLHKNKTQNWNLNKKIKFLSNNFISFNFTFIKLIFSKNYNIIHLCGWGDVLLVSSLLIAGILRIPITVESDIPYLKNISIYKKFKRIFYKIIFPIPKLFFPAGESQKSHLMKYGVPEKNIQKAYMTVKIEDLIKNKEGLNSYKIFDIRDKMKIDKDSILYLFVGRLVKEKALEMLIDSFIKASRINKNIHLLIVGDGYLFKKLKEKSIITNKITLAGSLSGKSLLDVYAIADVFILTSISEPWGLVINEAMASSLPIIVNKNVGCIKDLVKDGQNGFIVDIDKKNSTSQAILTLADNSKLRIKMANKSREIIKDWTLKNEAIKLSKGWLRIKK